MVKLIHLDSCAHAVVYAKIYDLPQPLSPQRRAPVLFPLNLANELLRISSGLQWCLQNL